MRRRRPIEVFSISFLDLICGALGAVIILYVAIPKGPPPKVFEPDRLSEFLSKDLEASRDEVRTLKAQLAQAKLEKLEADKKIPPAEAGPFDVGFQFKGRKIVFLVDTSYSMTEEDRMGQVKAGLKMLLTSLPSTHEVDIVQFPFGEVAPFKSLWGATRATTSVNKSDAFDFIYRMRPDGGTPTRDALLFVLQNYPGLSDIVVLSDGSPTLHNSNQKDDIYDILEAVRRRNTGAVRISSIGVGSEFTTDKQSDRYKFLSLLSSDHKGFFVGF